MTTLGGIFQAIADAPGNLVGALFGGGEERESPQVGASAGPIPVIEDDSLPEKVIDEDDVESSADEEEVLPMTPSDEKWIAEDGSVISEDEDVSSVGDVSDDEDASDEEEGGCGQCSAIIVGKDGEERQCNNKVSCIKKRCRHYCHQHGSGRNKYCSTKYSRKRARESSARRRSSARK